MFFWEGMKADILKFVSKCDICHHMKYESASLAGLLQPLPIPNHIWEDVSMDFIEGFPNALNVDTVLVVVDRMTKYAYFLTWKNPFTTIEMAQRFIWEVV